MIDDLLHRNMAVVVLTEALRYRIESSTDASELQRDMESIIDLASWIRAEAQGVQDLLAELADIPAAP
jgi:hypothetical protein